MSKARILGFAGVAIAGIAGACGGKVVFVEQGAGGATSSSSSSATSNSVATNGTAVTNVVSTGPCNSCECQPGGCTDAVSAVSGVGGGPASCFTCADVLEGNANTVTCAGPGVAAFNALVTCLCDPGVCGMPCQNVCGNNGAVNDACVSCETIAVSGKCSEQAATCAMN